jgi:hypothetical protein
MSPPAPKQHERAYIAAVLIGIGLATWAGGWLGFVGAALPSAVTWVSVWSELRTR